MRQKAQEALSLFQLWKVMIVWQREKILGLSEKTCSWCKLIVSKESI